MEVKEADFAQCQEELFGKYSKSEMNYPVKNIVLSVTAGVESDQQTFVNYITQGIPIVGGSLEQIRSLNSVQALRSVF